jgi:hypothetical protein
MTKLQDRELEEYNTEYMRAYLAEAARISLSYSDTNLYLVYLASADAQEIHASFTLLKNINKRK